MIDEKTIFYTGEKSKFDELLNQLGWTEESLLKEQEVLIECPIDRGHRFPSRSKHVQMCQLNKEGFSKEYLKELAEYEKEKQLLNQSDISFAPSTLTNILHRQIAITNNIPLNVQQTTVLFTSNERLAVAQAVHNEAMRLGIVPIPPLPLVDNLSIRTENSNLSQPSSESANIRDQKRRRTKYVTQTGRKSLYDSAREMINTGMELMQQIHHQIDSNQTQHDKDHVKPSKHKHRSSSKKKHHKKRRSSRSDSSKHHRHSKKRRKH